jgi:hypothetical protein
MERTMTKPKRIMKTIRWHLCRFEGESLVRLAIRKQRVAIGRLKASTPDSFVVSESIVVDETLPDVGTLYFADERGNSMRAYEGILLP